ncbi:hypothetical protein DPMN_068453 [Dreissena polymorpha]|uniref:Uncharacterized protein n=1 Tax=Dreissena polymorpha TaxID=45954 RepID=A0A9D4BWN3_DREPO|nr:hypothetical protein DPMN_068453 [Dreissena polymorpha]
MELEMLFLELSNRVGQCLNENRVRDSDFIVKAINKRQIEILIEMKQRMLMEGSSSLHDLKDLYVRIMK